MQGNPDLQTDLSVQRHYEAACSLRRQGRLDEAEKSLRAALSIRHDHFDSLCELGRLCLQKGRTDKAVRWFREAVARDPKSAVAHNELGIALAQAAGGNLDAAVLEFEAALALDPNFFLALNNLGNARVVMGRNEEAIASFERALVLQPEFAAAQYNYGRALAALGRHEQAIARFRKAIALNPGYVAAYNNLGYSLRAIERRSEALVAFDQALALDRNYGFAHAGRASILESMGKIADARASLERAVALMPGNPTFHGALAEIKHFRAGDPQIAAMEALLRKMAAYPAPVRIELHFALAKAYDDLQRQAAAFEQLREGNALKRASVVYNERAELGTLDEIATVYTSAVITAKRGSGDPFDVPMFVVGMPRSGTTLVEQILASHPAVFGGGERSFFAESVAAENPGGRGVLDVPAFSGEALRRIGGRYAAKLRALAPGAARIVDKLPENFKFAGLIHLALPNARIIHVSRDPADTCFSCYSKLFAGALNYTYDLGELGRYYQAYEKLMAHWRAVLPEGTVLDVKYETLVEDLEAQARRLIAACGLEWDARCLEFHKTERGVHTASQFQVRQPIYKSSIGRWRPYENHLRPLLEVLNRH